MSTSTAASGFSPSAGLSDRYRAIPISVETPHKSPHRPRARIIRDSPRATRREGSMGGSATALALYLRLHKTAWGRTACIGYLLTIGPLPANCRADSVVLSAPAPKNRSWPGAVRVACGSEAQVGGYFASAGVCQSVGRRRRRVAKMGDAVSFRRALKKAGQKQDRQLVFEILR